MQWRLSPSLVEFTPGLSVCRIHPRFFVRLQTGHRTSKPSHFRAIGQHQFIWNAEPKTFQNTSPSLRHWVHVQSYQKRTSCTTSSRVFRTGINFYMPSEQPSLPSCQNLRHGL